MRVHRLIVPREFRIDELQRLSQTAASFRSEITVEYAEDGNVYTIDMKSILGTLLLSFRQGTEITIRTKGKDEEEAIDWLCGAIEPAS